MKILFTLTFLMFSLFWAKNAFSGIVPTTREEIKTTPGNPVDITVLPSGVYREISLSPMAVNQMDIFRKGVITFGVDHKYGTIIAPYHVKIKLQISTYINQLNSTPDNVYTETLELDYDPQNMLSFIDKQILEIANVEKYKVELLYIEETPLSGPGAGTPASVNILKENLYVYLDLFANRITDFTSTSGMNVSGLLNPHTLIDLNSDTKLDEIQINWNTVPGAEEYQLEWCFVNDYTYNFNSGSPTYITSNLPVDFRNNSTRISTSNTSYKISLAFDHGYLCYRVRAVGRKIPDYEKLLYTSWTAPDYVANIFVPSIAKYHVVTPFEVEKNWQYSSTYAEEGKKKEVVTFFDGSLRNRQMVTKINSDKSVIVGETLYDHQGRPVIQVLPAPAVETIGNENSLMYYPYWSRVDNSTTLGEEYNKSVFDVSASGSPCAVTGIPMFNEKGASNYYSSANPNTADEQGYLPEANGYPFSQVEYTPDNTGRIRRQGGVGEEFQLGSNHETKYFYGHPFQEQLNDLFGSEVGDASHYQKNMVIDANGQTSISYLDQEGRVIATSLAGESPTALLPISSSGPAALISVDLFAKDANGVSTSNTLRSDGKAMVFSQSILLTSQSSIQVDYSMSVGPYSDSCLENICFSCAYDLEITITNECGDTVPKSDLSPAFVDTLIGNFNVVNGDLIFETTNCGNTTDLALTESLTTIPLAAGNYFITKTLTVNQDALNQYTQLFLDTTICLPTFDSLLAIGNANNDIDCDPTTSCAACVAALGTVENFITTGQGTENDYISAVNACNEPCVITTYVDLKRQTLLSDLMPNGQYAEYQTTTGVFQPSSFPLSILNVSNQLSGGANRNWKYPKLFINGNVTAINEYRDEDLTTRTRVQVIPTFSGATISSTQPAVNSPLLGTNVFLDAATLEYYTYPELLSNVADFIDEYQANPSWAMSLITYHPEYHIFRTIEEAEKTHSGSSPSNISSEQFDINMMQAEHWTDGVALNFMNNSGVLTWAVDPFNGDFGLYGMTLNQFKNKVNNYITIGGTPYSLMQFASIVKKCGASSFGAGVLLPMCSQWGTGTAQEKDDEWQFFKSLYINLKREMMLAGALKLTISQGYTYPGYNGCIGEDNFNPFENGFFGFIGGAWPWYGILNTQFLNLNQPCSFPTDQLYQNKDKRFFNPIDDYDGNTQNNVAYQQYLLTGQCPNASALQNFISEVASSGNLIAPSFSANSLPTFNGLLYALNNSTVPTSVPGVTWSLVSMSSTTLKTKLMDGATSFATLEFAVPSTNVPFDWSTVVSFSGLQYQSTNSTYGFDIFTVLAKCDDGNGGFYTIILTCKTSLSIGNCTFNDVCYANQLGKDVKLILNAIASANLLGYTAGVDLQAPVSGYPVTLGSFVSTPLQIAANNAITTQLTYAYDNTIPGFTFYQSGTNKKLVVKIIGSNPTFSPGMLTSISNVSAMEVLSDNTFKLECKNSGGTVVSVLTCEIYQVNNGAITNRIIGSCHLPTPALCSDLSYQNTGYFKDLFNEVFSLQTPNYDLLATMSLDNQLLSQFSGISTTLPGIASTTVVNGENFNVLSFGISPNCPLVLKLNTSTYPGLNYSQLTGITEISISSTVNNYGSYNTFTMHASTSNPSYPMVEIEATSCINVNICEGCSTNPNGTFTASKTGGVANKKVETIENNTVEEYKIYTQLISDFNTKHKGEVGNELSVEAISYLEYVSNEITTVKDPLFDFILNFDSSVDNYALLVDPLLFKTNFNTLKSAQTPEDSCKILYDIYVAAYYSFANFQSTNNNCPGFLQLYPLLSLAEFEHRNLCCTDQGLEVFNQFIFSFMNPKGCPIALSTLKDCKPSTDPIDSIKQCEIYYKFYVGAIDFYNQSPYAQVSGIHLTLDYPDFTSFYNADLCFCIESYLQNIQYFSNLTYQEAQSETGTLKAIEDFCREIGDPKDSCKVLYELYLATYQGFLDFQTQYNTCPNFTIDYPLMTLADFEKRNLCCSAHGLASFNSYIISFMTTQGCPGQIASYPDCDSLGHPIDSIKDCEKLFQNYADALKYYNLSPFATITNQYLSIDYTDFQTFYNAGLCQCLEDYLLYLLNFANMTPSQIQNSNAVVQTIDEFCQGTPEPPICEIQYAAYLTCVNQYNNWTVNNQAPSITTIFTEQSFYDLNLCICVDVFCSEINAILSNTVIPAKAPDILKICFDGPPCDLENPFPGDLESLSIPFENPCDEFMETNISGNAWNTYSIEIQNAIAAFQTSYINHCMGALEDMQMEFNQIENHFTLYYYDQAGNLIKTIPPEGVQSTGALFSSTVNQAINADRLNGTHNQLTNHRLATTYKYNSLNQLVAQGNPDQDKMDVFDVTLPNGLLAKLQTNAIQMVNENLGYLSGYVSVPVGTSFNNKRGYLYKTTNGGSNWTQVPNLVGSDLVEIENIPGTDISYAIGKQGVFLRTIDNGANWDLINTYGTTSALVPVVANFVALEVTQSGANYVLTLATENGKFYTMTHALGAAMTIANTPANYANNLVTYSSLFTFVKLKDFELINNTIPIALVRYSEAGNEFDAIMEKTSLTSTWVMRTTNLPEIKAISMYNNYEGIAAGVDGDEYSIFNSTLAGFTPFAIRKESSPFVKNILQTFALNKDRRIVRIENGLVSEAYYTLDNGQNWTLLDVGTENLRLGMVSRSATSIDIVAVSKHKIKRIRLLTSGALVLYDQTMLGSLAVNNFESVSAIVNGNDVRYVAITTAGAVHTSQVHSAGNTDVSFTLLSNSGLTACKEIQGIYSGTTFGIVVRGGSTNTLTKSTSTTIGGTFSAFTAIASSTNSIDIDVIGTGSTKNIAVLNSSTLKVGTINITLPAPTIVWNTIANDAGSLVMGTYDNFAAVSGTNGKIQIKSYVPVTTAVISKMAITRFAPSLNAIEENLSNLIVTGNNGTVLTRSLVTSANVYNSIPVGVTDNLYSSERYSGNSLVGGDNGTLLSINDATQVATPLLLINGASVKSTFSSISFRAMDYKKIGTDEALYVVGTNGTALYTPNILITAFGGNSNLSDNDFNAVKWKVNSNFAMAAGNNASISTLAQLFATKTKNVFTAEVRDVHFADVNVGTVVGDHYLLRSTTDGGLTWKIHHDPLPTFDKATYLRKAWTVTRPDGKHFAFVGGDRTFNTLSNNLITAYYVGLFNTRTVTDFNFHPIDRKEGYVATTSGHLLALHLTANGSGSWDLLAGYVPTSTPTLTAGLPTNTKAIHMFENKSVLAVGNASARFIQPNGSIITNPISLNLPTVQLNDVFFHDDKDGYMVGDNGKFYILNNLNPITSPDFESTPKTIKDPIIFTSSNYNVKCIAFGTRYDGIYGGNHPNMSDPLVLNSAFVRKLHHEPSQFSSRFYYDRLGRLVVSQNSRQAAQEKFSYTRYDDLGRVFEVGEKTENDLAINPNAPVFKGIFGTYVGNAYIPSVIDDAKMSAWVQFQDPGQGATRLEVTRSFYDNSYSPIASQLPTTFTPNELTQRKRIVHVTYEAKYDGDETTYDHATHYDYDIHGNVKTLIQDNRLLLAVSDIDHHRFKRFDYVFDLVSGNVHRMDYQTGEADQWHHSYNYDADNRILDVHTTASTPLVDATTGIASVQNEPAISTYWEKEANYNYFDHGPLARTTLGDQEVQGVDYAYTLQGWLKGINSNGLQASNDIGKDGDAFSPHFGVGRDVASFSLHYYQGDYTSIVAGNNNFIAGLSAGDLFTNAYNLYNGNIGRMITTITDPTTGDIHPMGNAYRYDQLQRLRQSVSYVGLDVNTNDWGSSQSGDHYRNEFVYDANGNIMKQLRYKFGNTTADKIDDLVYRYKEVSGQKVQNRLYHVNDGSANTDAEELLDMGVFTPGGNINQANNYKYDPEGRLIYDNQEKIDQIVWRVDGKVKNIYRTPGSGKDAVSFDYDAMGNRIAKHVYNDQNQLTSSTYYVLDGQGNTISTYEHKIDNVGAIITFEQSEKHIYGSSRLGVTNAKLGMLGSQNNTYSQDYWSHTIGERTYEIANHLGNVLSVISDKPIPHDNGGTLDYYLADLRSSQDYSPFGVTLQDREYALSGAEGYRYGFQGQEKDDEISGSGNTYTARFWEYDSRSAVRWNLDPVVKHFESGYSVFGRSPILMVDPNGDDWYISKAGKEKGSYKWFEGSGEQKGFAHAGAYKVEYDKIKNVVNVYEGKDSKFKETINMEAEKDAKGNFVKYKDDRAAKFAMISAETGGANVNDKDPSFDPLIISASIDNRQKVADAGHGSFSSSKGQVYKGFHAKSHKAYKDFKHGNKKRFNDNLYYENLSLSTVYNAMDNPVIKLQNNHSVAEAKYILYYSHLGGSAQGGTAFNITYPIGKTDRFVSVQGDTKYKKLLNTK